MSIIHSALKKAEADKQRKLDPGIFSIGDLAAMAQEQETLAKIAGKRISPYRKLWTVLLAAAVATAAGSWLFLSWFQGYQARTQSALESELPPVKHKKMRNAEALSTVPAGITLTGIVLEGEKPLALINGRVLQTGDSVMDWRIVRIENERVVLSKGSEERVAALR
jgi:hypothetical protein